MHDTRALKVDKAGKHLLGGGRAGPLEAPQIQGRGVCRILNVLTTTTCRHGETEMVGSRGGRLLGFGM